MEITVADETTLLVGMLDRQREKIAAMLDGLSEEEARARLVPSLTTPMGLVKHCTFVEKVWFHSRVTGIPRQELGLPDTVDESFELTDADTVASVRSAYDAACAHSREVAAGRSLDETYDWRGVTVNLRFLYGHMIQELAHHAGHGDILVEQLVAARS